MNEFKKLTIQDKITTEKIFSLSNPFPAPTTFGTIYIWKDVYDSYVYFYDNYFLQYHKGFENFYNFPIGHGDIKSALNFLQAHAHKLGHKLNFIGLTEDEAKYLAQIMPDKFVIKEHRNDFNYIYNKTDLAELAGRKYHGKRNFIAQFKKSYSWSYETLTKRNISDCIKVEKAWEQTHDIADSVALQDTFKNFSELDFTGGVLYVSTQPVAFAIGEKIAIDTFVIHFMKALIEYKGSFPMITQQFVLNELTKYKYISFEEDMGIEGLRKSKLSYHPAYLQKKYRAFEKI